MLIVCAGGLSAGGGIGRQMENFLAARRQGGTIDYSVLDTRGATYINGRALAVLPAAWRLLNCLLALARERLRPGPVLLHVNLAGRGSLARKSVVCAWASLIGLPYILHGHEPDLAREYRRRGAVMRFAARRCFAGARAAILLGDEARAALRPLVPMPRGGMQVLANAVPRAVTARRPPGRAPVHLVFLGHLDTRKGVGELLGALAEPGARDLDWQLTLAGGGAVKPFSRMAQAYGLAERTRFAGPLDHAQVEKLLLAADVLVLPSHAEGLSMAVLEGLAAGLAVIATPVGAHADVIEHGVCGLLVPPGDVPALCGALRSVILDGDLRARLQDGARRRHAQAFDIAPYAERLAGLHAALMDAP